MVNPAPGTEAAVAYAARELRAHYAAAPESLRERGRHWYDRAKVFATREARRHGYTRTQVAAIIAVTSPDAQLAANLRWTQEILAGTREAGRYPADQTPKVRAILADRKRPGQYVSGPKVTAFFRAILGDTDAVVIDRWAAFAAGGSKDAAPRTSWRKTYEAAYRLVAAETGETVRDLQAIVWEQVRETTPDSAGRIHRRANVHEEG